MMEMISKTVRMPADLVKFIESKPGDNFSQQLLGILDDYRNGDQIRQKELQNYRDRIFHYSELYQRLDDDYMTAYSVLLGFQNYLDSLREIMNHSLPELPDIRADTADDPDLKPGAMPFT